MSDVLDSRSRKSRVRRRFAWLAGAPMLFACFLVGLVCSVRAETSHTLSPVAPFGLPQARWHWGLGGQVSLAGDGPAVGALVELYNGWQVETSATVKSDGAFNLPFPEEMSGFHEIRIRHRGWATFTADLPGLGSDLSTVTLERAVRFEGRATDTAGNALPGIECKLSTPFFDETGKPIVHSRGARRPVHSQTCTDRSGGFTFDDVVAGEYMVVFSGETYISEVRRVRAPVADLAVTLRQAHGTVRGVTVRHGTGEPLPATTVSVSLMHQANERKDSPRLSANRTTLSGPAGEFEFRGLEPGTWEINARRADMKRIPFAHSPSSSFDTFAVSVNEGRPVNTTVTLYSGHTVSGRVLDEETSRPLPGVRVIAGSLDRAESVAITDEEGRFAVDRVFTSGLIYLWMRAEKAGYLSAGTERSPRPTLIPEVRLTQDNLQPHVEFSMRRDPKVR